MCLVTTFDTETGLPVRLLHDRILVLADSEGERKSTAGIVIPATASMGAHRLSWATTVAVGPLVRAVQVDDRVLFDPDDRAEVELHGKGYVLLRERDVHAVAASRMDDNGTGLYL